MKRFRLAAAIALFWILAAAPSAHAASLLVASIGTNQVLRYDASTGAFLGVFAQGGGLSIRTDWHMDRMEIYSSAAFHRPPFSNMTVKQAHS